MYLPPPKDEEIECYGYSFVPKPKRQIDVEMAIFRDMPLGPDRFRHYKAIVDTFFGPQSALPYVWTRRALCMAKAFCSERVVYVSGNSNSGKTRALAIYLFVSWLCDPLNAKGICVSTGIESAQHRVWGDALKLLNSMPLNADGSVSRYPTWEAFALVQVEVGHPTRFSLLPQSDSIPADTCLEFA